MADPEVTWNDGHISDSIDLGKYVCLKDCDKLQLHN